MGVLYISLPCLCFKCLRYKTRKSLKNFHCMGIEELDICKNRDCETCDFECKQFITELSEGKLIDFIE